MTNAFQSNWFLLGNVCLIGISRHKYSMQPTLAEFTRCARCCMKSLCATQMGEAHFACVSQGFTVTGGWRWRSVGNKETFWGRITMGWPGIWNQRPRTWRPRSALSLRCSHSLISASLHMSTSSSNIGFLSKDWPMLPKDAGSYLPRITIREKLILVPVQKVPGNYSD